MAVLTLAMTSWWRLLAQVETDEEAVAVSTPWVVVGLILLTVVVYVVIRARRR